MDLITSRKCRWGKEPADPAGARRKEGRGTQVRKCCPFTVLTLALSTEYKRGQEKHESEKLCDVGGPTCTLHFHCRLCDVVARLGSLHSFSRISLNQRGTQGDANDGQLVAAAHGWVCGPWSSAGAPASLPQPSWRVTPLLFQPDAGDRGDSLLLPKSSKQGWRDRRGDCFTTPCCGLSD